MEKLYRLPADTEGTFHSEIYYINLATQMGIKWGTDSKVRLFDPASGLYVELGASGEFNLRVVDSRKLLLKIVGTAGGLGQTEILGAGGGKGFFRAMVMTHVKSYLAQVIKENGINVLEIDAHLMTLSEALRERINAGLADYGLTMPEFYVARVVTPDDDPNFRRMKEQYAEQYLLIRQEQIKKSEAEAAQARKMVEAETAARMKIIEAQGSAEAYRIRAQAEADEMKMKGYTYQQETARQVGMEAMKNGITGGESGSGIGDIAGLGVALGAMSGVIGMTKEAMGPIMGGGDIGKSVTEAAKPDAALAPDPWDCACGQKGIHSKFCPECGSPRPSAKPAADTWDCPNCGLKGITSKFCPECGAKRPEMPSPWTCPNCGKTGITSKFCPECGHKREG